MTVKPYVLFAALGISPAVAAQSVDTSEWACEFCPFAEGHDAEYDVGASSVSDDSAWFGNATGYDEKGIYANLDGQGLQASENHRLRWLAEDLGLASRALEVEGGKPGSYGYSLGWRELPLREYITTSTMFLDDGAAGLALPADWVRAPLTTGFTALDADLVPRDIEGDRRTLSIGGHYLPTNRLRISADYRRREKDGIRSYGAPSFTNASLAPMAYDYVTDEVEFGARYGTVHAFVSLGWYLSDFENGNPALTWEQPFTTAPGAETAALSQAPDSKFQQLAIAAGYSFPDYATVVSLSGAFGRIDQNTAFLPYTTNPNLVVMALPRTSLGGDVETGSYSFAVSSNPLDKLRIRLDYRYDERNNKTAQDAWSRVIVDALPSGDAEMNVPYSFERSKFAIRGDYDLFRALRLSAEYERRDVDRDYQEVASQTEDTGWGRVRWRPLDSLEIDARGGTAKRKIGAYDESIAVSYGQNPLMRKYNLAQRYREFGELDVSWSPSTLPLSIGFVTLYADDDYDRSQLGLRRGREISIAADFNWAVSENSAMYVNVGDDTLESEQYGRESFALPDWQASYDDSFLTATAGFDLRHVTQDIGLRFDITSSRGKSEISVDSAASPPEDFPDLETELERARLLVDYRRSDTLTFNFSVIYQRFETTDWSIEGVQPATIPQVLTLGALPYDDDVLIVGVSVSFHPVAR